MKKRTWRNILTALGLYAFALLCALYTLFEARRAGLLGMPVSNMDQYPILEMAFGIAEGRLPRFVEGYWYSPLYTFFVGLLAWLGDCRLVLMRALQAVLLAAVPSGIFFAGLALRLGRKASLLGAVGFIFLPVTVLLSLEFLRASFLAGIVVLVLLAGAKAFNSGRTAWYLVFGLACGCAVLGRENFYFLPFAIAPLLLSARVRRRLPRNWVAYAALAAGVLAAILPVCFYNLAVLGKFGVLPGVGGGVLRFFYGSPEPLAVWPQVAARLPGTLFDMVCSYEIPNSISIYAFREVIPFLNIFCLPFNVALVLAATGLLLRRDKIGIWFLALLCAGYFGSLSFVEFFYRYRIPILPVVALGAGCGVYRLFIELKFRRLRAAVVLITALLLIWASRSDPEKRISPQEKNTTASYLVSLKRYDDAERCLRRERAKGAPLYAAERELLSGLLDDGQTADVERLCREWNYRPEPSVTRRSD